MFIILLVCSYYVVNYRKHKFDIIMKVDVIEKRVAIETLDLVRRWSHVTKSIPVTFYHFIVCLLSVLVYYSKFRFDIISKFS